MLTLLLVLGLGLQDPASADSTALAAYDTPPRLLKHSRPSYPDAAFYQRIEGTVVLEFVIDTDGRVGRIKVLESIPALDQAAIETIRKWRFAPALTAGKPVATVAQSPVSFCISDNPCRESRKKSKKR